MAMKRSMAIDTLVTVVTLTVVAARCELRDIGEDVMQDEIQEFFDDNAGVASVSELATLLDESEGRIRAWARANPDNVRRIGSTFCFTPEAAELLLTDFEEQDEDQEDFDEAEADVAASGAGGDDDSEDDDDDEEED